MDLILASTSPYRKALLRRLELPFRCAVPEVTESQLEGESAAAMAGRLARLKAQAVAALEPDALVIGSDQVACLNGRIMGKPGSHERAREQLQSSSGRELRFHTGLALVCRSKGLDRFHVEPFSVFFRRLTATQIENYLHRERPYDCAGSFKCEGLGIALFQRLRGDDPTSLEGLPLISLVGMLCEAGLEIPAPPS